MRPSSMGKLKLKIEKKFKKNVPLEERHKYKNWTMTMILVYDLTQIL